MANSSSCGAEHIARARALSNGMLTRARAATRPVVLGRRD
jgi:hypothetical protein